MEGILWKERCGTRYDKNGIVSIEIDKITLHG